MQYTLATTYPDYDEIPEGDCVSFMDLEKQAERDLVYLEKYLQSMYGKEFYSPNGLTRLLAGVLNTFGHIANTFKTNLFRSYRVLKRTELIYYGEANVATLPRILNTQYELVRNLEIPVPDKMSVPYFDAADQGYGLLTLLDMKNTTNMFVKDLEEVLEKVMGATTPTLVLRVPDRLPAIVKSFKKFDSYFKGPKKQTYPFTKMFRTMDEFRSVHRTLVGAAEFHYSVERIVSNMDKCTNLLKTILSFMEKDGAELPKETIVRLSEMAMYYAKVFDMFGVAIQDMARIEHNFVEVLKSIRKELNL
jgi:hypothetical protein